MCNMQVFGVSGSTSGTSGICVLPINIINEKIYLVLWLWFLGLTLLCLLQLVRQAALLVPSLRACLSPGLASSLTSPRQVRRLAFLDIHWNPWANSAPPRCGDTVLLQLVAANCDSSQVAALVQVPPRPAPPPPSCWSASSGCRTPTSPSSCTSPATISTRSAPFSFVNWLL
jgi:hypothetical protein